jgi:branched-chain amino acid aminotransferase
MADRDGKIWMDGQMVDWRDAKIHVLTHTLHYGCGAFEGVRAYNTVNGTAIFRLQEHTERLFNSAKILRMKIRSPGRGQRGAKGRGARQQAGVVLPAPADLDRRQEAGRLAQGQHHPPDGGRLGLGRLPGRGRHEARHPRQDQQLHAPPRQHHDDAGQGGEQLHQLHPGQHGSHGRGLRRSAAARRAGFVSEGAGENIFVVKNGVVYTPDLSAGALNGITRNTVFHIAKDLGLELVQKRITRDEVYIADEAFFTGTPPK